MLQANTKTCNNSVETSFQPKYTILAISKNVKFAFEDQNGFSEVDFELIRWRFRFVKR